MSTQNNSPSASLTSTFAALGLNPVANRYNPDRLASALTALNIRPTAPSAPSSSNPFPELHHDAAYVPEDTLNCVDYCIFIADLDLATIQESLWERFAISVSIDILRQIVAAERYIIEAMMSATPLPEHTIAEPYRIRLRAYRALTQHPGLGHEILQERLKVLNAVYLGALEAIGDIDQRLASFGDLFR